MKDLLWRGLAGLLVLALLLLLGGAVLNVLRAQTAAQPQEARLGGATPTLAASALASTPTATATFTASPPYRVATWRDVSYGPEASAGEVLDLCAPVGAAAPRPGVLLIHGGTWTSGDKSAYTTTCALLATRGFVAATLNYRLAPTYHWPAQLVDVQLAMRWLRAHASDYDLDPRRVCALGDSAGGHLAALLSVLGTIQAGDQAGLLTDQPVRASCLVDLFGPVDLATIGTPAERQALFQGLFGDAALQQDPGIVRAASPLFAVSPQSAPTLIIQGTQDTLVPPSQSQAFQQALERAGVPVQSISYVGGHEFSGLSQSEVDALTRQAEDFLMAQEQP